MQEMEDRVVWTEWLQAFPAFSLNIIPLYYSRY
jgi:hypothetical protein